MPPAIEALGISPFFGAVVSILNFVTSTRISVLMRMKFLRSTSSFFPAKS